MKNYEKFVDPRNTAEFKKFKKDLLAKIRGKTDDELHAMRKAAAVEISNAKFIGEQTCAIISEYTRVREGGA